jgi:hypothetical protein
MIEQNQGFFEISLAFDRRTFDSGLIDNLQKQTHCEGDDTRGPERTILPQIRQNEAK